VAACDALVVVLITGDDSLPVSAEVVAGERRRTEELLVAEVSVLLRFTCCPDDCCL